LVGSGVYTLGGRGVKLWCIAAVGMRGEGVEFEGWRRGVCRDL
jgi:hypothetical protein